MNLLQIPSTAVGDASWLASFKDTPFTFTILAILIIVVVALIFAVPKFFQYLSRKADNAKELRLKIYDTAKTPGGVPANTDEFLLKLSAQIDDIRGLIVHVTKKIQEINFSQGNEANLEILHAIQEEMGEIKTISINADLKGDFNTVHNRNAPMWDRLVAANNCFKTGWNHNLKTFVVENLIMKRDDGVELWRSVLNEDRKSGKECKNSAYLEILKYIDKVLY